jgi:hypothetical protein
MGLKFDPSGNLFSTSENRSPGKMRAESISLLVLIKTARRGGLKANATAKADWALRAGIGKGKGTS